jgi:1,4-dihydroxy-2-naphthoyl-CoA hydrolase
VLAETLGSIAANLCMDDPSQQAAGIEINANHLRAVTEGWVIGTATPIHVGRATQVWDIRIVDERDKPVCVARLTLAVRSA